MRPTILLLACLALTLGGCCGGSPTMTLRNPLQFDAEPNTTAGPRLMQAPTYYVPQYAPVQAAPKLPAGYAPAASCR